MALFNWFKDIFGRTKAWLDSKLTIPATHRAENIRCHLCYNTVKVQWTEFGSLDLRSFSEAMQKIRWHKLWLTNWTWVCCDCCNKLVLGLVPGVGIHPVTKEMLAQGKALPVDDFLKAENIEKLTEDGQ